MNLLFIHDWAERSPKRRWPCVYALLLIMIILGCAVAPDPYPEAMSRDEVKAECHRVYGLDATILENDRGDLVCRKGRSA